MHHDALEMPSGEIVLEHALITQAVPRFPNQSAVPNDTRKFQVGPRLSLDGLCL
jgi:hypothetical protein